MRRNQFSKQVAKFTDKSEALVMAVFRESLQRVIADAQTPAAKGGRMRVDTGFLRNSGQPSLDGLPVGPSRNTGSGPGEPADVALVLAKLQPGAPFWFGWTAAYARPREYKDGFLRMAVMKWQRTVAEVAREARSRRGR